MKTHYNAAEITAAILIGTPLVLGFFALNGLFWGFIWNSLIVFIFPSLPILDFWKACLLGLLMSCIFAALNKK